MEVTAPIDLRGTVLILNLKLRWQAGSLLLTGTVEISPTLPAAGAK